MLISRPLHPEIYNRKPVTAVMDATAVQIDGRARLEQVSRMVTGQQARQQEDFIITRAGEYLGLGRSIDLLRQITAQQIQMAKQANPLTGLPGNREIQAHLSQLVNRRRTFIACHLDLDNFKPFNDTYGYQQGDQVLLHVATTIQRNIRPRMDFVGHIGGDDYVLLLRSRDWSIRLLSILEDLAVTLVNFHSAEHRQAGHIMAHGRDGVLDPVSAAERVDRCGRSRSSSRHDPGLRCRGAAPDQGRRQGAQPAAAACFPRTDRCSTCCPTRRWRSFRPPRPSS